MYRMNNTVEFSLNMALVMPITKEIKFSNEDWLMLYASTNYQEVPPDHLTVTRMQVIEV